MFTTRNLAATALIALLSTPLYAAVENVAKIDATVDISAINNAQAATFWANLEADLENAIAARVTDRLVTEEAKPDAEGRIDGTQIKVDVREVELATAFERELITRTLQQCGGRVTEAARQLGIGRATLYKKMAALGLPSRSQDIPDRHPRR